jgi:transmembrane sensor
MAQNRFWNLLAKKLAGDATPAELEELELLLKQQPELSYFAEQASNLWKQRNQPQDEYDAELAFELHLNKLKDQGISLPELETPFHASAFEEKTTGKIPAKRLISFIIIAAIVIAASVFWQRLNSPKTITAGKNLSEVSTKPGSKSKLVLPDGTVVWLNAGSTLTYGENFGTSSRNTTLVGEAFFDVKKSTIPFVIHASSVQIKVLGTAFNVKSYPNEKTTETSLVRGSVEITLDRRPGEKFILKPNEKLVVANEPEEPKQVAERKRDPLVVLSSLTHTIKDEIVETSWVENKLIFQDESLSDLTKKMERWYGVSIAIKNEKIANERFTGTFTTETIEAALEELQMITAFHFTIKSNSIEITR